jgi:hypothetical protein
MLSISVMPAYVGTNLLLNSTSQPILSEYSKSNHSIQVIRYFLVDVKTVGETSRSSLQGMCSLLAGKDYYQLNISRSVSTYFISIFEVKSIESIHSKS